MSHFFLCVDIAISPVGITAVSLKARGEGQEKIGLPSFFFLEGDHLHLVAMEEGEVLEEASMYWF